ncbi:MAG: hypothetical protein M3R17_13090 [Bacteroidota bacterium]|nr:hypothetical protein [Bacteroidota bacterium]
MQSRTIHSAEKESRSVAHENGKSNAVACPSVSGWQTTQPSQKTVQLFKTGNIAQEAHLVSDDDAMAVRTAGSDEFLAKQSVALAEPVLNLVNKVEDYGAYKISTTYDSDCGGYADNLMRRIALFDRKKEIAGKETVNIQGGPIPRANPNTLFQETIASQPAPGIGQAYIIVNDPNDPQFGKSHFNFHWGTVIAKSGNDVMTAETGSHTSTMKFDMYSQSVLSQSFHQRYMDAKKLNENAKTFQVNFTKTAKQTV